MQVLTNQEFTYRESPAEQDGYGKFKALYGNTLVWNQLVQNGNFADNSKWSLPSTATAVISNNELSSTYASAYPSVSQALSIKAGHKFYLSFEYKASVNNNTPNGFFFSDTQDRSVLVTALNYTTTYKKYEGILSYSNNDLARIRLAYFEPNRWTAGDVISIKNVQLFDLTQMGLDISSPSEFTSLFPKPYYDYCQGAMLSFGGRNVKFNQLLQNGNFADTSKWLGTRGTMSASANVLSYTISEVGSSIMNRIQNNSAPLTQNHKYLMAFDIKPLYTNNIYAFSVTSTYGVNTVATLTPSSANTWNRMSCIFTNSLSSSLGVGVAFECSTNYALNDVIQIRNYVLFDLTEMFGVGNEPSAEGFKELFPNDYYEYNVGQYMNLGQPVSLKTVGKNILVDSGYVQGVLGWNNSPSDSNITANNAYISSPFIPIPNGVTQITITSPKGNIVRYWEADSGYNGLYFSGNHPMQGETITRTLSQGCKYVRISIGIDAARVTPNDYGTLVYGQIEFGNQATDYEPYTESTLSIPLDEFPNGMDGINDIRDEKNETGYVKRIGQVDVPISSPNWVIHGSDRFYLGGWMPSNISSNRNANLANNKGLEIQDLQNTYGNYLWFGSQGLYINRISSTETIAEMQTRLSGLKLYYELATPLENYGVVDLGSMSWTAITQNNVIRMRSFDIKTLIKYPFASNRIANMVCVKYPTLTANNTYDGQIGISCQNNGDIYVHDSAYSTADAFKQAMQGVYLLYDKKNPQGLVYPPQSKEEYPFFKSYKAGAEQLLPENGSVPVTAPILADMNYSSGAIEVTTYPNPEQGGETSGDGWYLVGEEATVNALPNEHYAFNNWVLDGETVSTDPEYTFEVQDE